MQAAVAERGNRGQPFPQHHTLISTSSTNKSLNASQCLARYFMFEQASASPLLCSNEDELYQTSLDACIKAIEKFPVNKRQISIGACGCHLHGLYIAPTNSTS